MVKYEWQNETMDFTDDKEFVDFAHYYGTLNDPNKTVRSVYDTFVQTGKVGDKQIRYGVMPNGTTVMPDNAENLTTELTGYDALYANAKSYLDSGYKNAGDIKNASYAGAARTRSETEALAEIQRKRSIVDADTMSAQERASYGANAEQLGRMGLQVSGYSDYLNSQAYATGMAARQAANAQATETKRQATYQEALARLEADKVYSQATAEADKTYYGMINEIEAQKISDAKEKEAQQQTNYGNLIDAIVKSNGAINGENVATYASALGVTDTKLLEDAKDFATTYWENTPKTLTEAETIKLQQKLANQEAVGDYLGVADTTVEINNYTASDEQKQVAKANYVAQSIDRIVASETQTKQLSDTIDNYGTEGANIIKAAFSEYVASNVDVNDKEVVQKVLNTNLLTDETRANLENLYTEMVTKEGAAEQYPKMSEKEIENRTVNVNQNDFKYNSFGNYAGISSKTSAQYKYVTAIIEATKIPPEEGGLKEGDIVQMNYGNALLTERGSRYTYKGNGVFLKTEDVIFDASKLFVPKNYIAEQYGYDIEIKEK